MSGHSESLPLSASLITHGKLKSFASSFAKENNYLKPATLSGAVQRERALCLLGAGGWNTAEDCPRLVLMPRDAKKRKH